MPRKSEAGQQQQQQQPCEVRVADGCSLSCGARTYIRLLACRLNLPERSNRCLNLCGADCRLGTRALHVEHKSKAQSLGLVLLCYCCTGTRCV